MRLAPVLCLLAVPAWADGNARKSAKFLTPTKAPFQTHYPKGCGPRDKVVAVLTGPEWQETLVSREPDSQGRIAEVWGGAKSWTWTVTNGSGVTCVIRYGGIRSRDDAG